MKIEINKKYQTRDGGDVVIHATDGPREGYPVIASVSSPGAIGGWFVRDFSDQGIQVSGELTELDLIEVIEPREWVIRGHTRIEANVVDSGPIARYGESVRVREIID